MGEGYYLGIYLNELPNEYSITINSLGLLVIELRKHDLFFKPESKVHKRLGFIQAKLNQN